MSVLCLSPEVPLFTTMLDRKHLTAYRDYYAYLARKTTLGGSMVFLTVLGVSCLGMTLIGATMTAACLCIPFLWEFLFSPLIFTLLMAGGAWAFLMLGTRAENTSNQLKPVRPPTRRMFGKLPESVTLVRAAQEPTEDPEKVLLRPAQPTAETREEELLRPSLIMKRFNCLPPKFARANRLATSQVFLQNCETSHICDRAGQKSHF